MRQRRAGLTLIELLVVFVMTGILAVAIGYAFVGGLDLERAQSRRQTQTSERERFERRVVRLLEAAKLDEDSNDRMSYFVAETGETDEDLGCSRITFTTNASDFPLETQESTDDFQTQHDTLGPQGGLAEISWGSTPIGDAGERTGLFERLQRPSDGDATQGGTESVLTARVLQIGFKFYNGESWISTWDTLTSDRRLPAAVQVSYVLDDDASTVHRLIVPLLSSDVDAQNPANTGVLQ